MKKIVIFGATSAIAIGAARLWAEQGNSFVLVGRDEQRLKAVSADLEARGGTVRNCLSCDLGDSTRHSDLWASVKASFDGPVDIILVAHGALGDQASAVANPDVLKDILNINFVSVAELLTIVANDFELWKSGTIAVIGSVAGDRGRQSNYAYGAAKAGLAAFLSGLRNRLTPVGVGVLTVKPGFVDTPMTAHLPKGPLFASPAAVGAGIVRAIEKHKGVVYLPWFWQPIMLIITHIPEQIFRKLRL